MNFAQDGQALNYAISATHIKTFFAKASKMSNRGPPFRRRGCIMR